jgi:phenylacetate-CoA ligase
LEMSSLELYEPAIETMSRDELENLQLNRLKWQLDRCYAKSAFYKEKLDKAGIRPEDINSVSDIMKLPVVTKQELREEQEKYPPYGRYTVSPPEDWREIHPTTGTTGAQVYNIWSEQDVENITHWTARTLWNFGVRPGDIIQNAFSYGLWVAGMSSHYAARELGCLVIPIGATPADRQIDYLIGTKATVLLATPSFALYLGEKLAERRVSPDSLALRIGCFGGEPGAAVASTRDKIESGLGIEAFDYYGLAEIGPTCASECPEKAGIHWAEDHILVELVNPQTMEWCEPDEAGVLVMTHLTKEATPMIRYWTNDVAKLDVKRCACGRTHAKSPGGILGRADDMIVYRGAKFYPTQVEKVLRGFKELADEYRIELTTDEKRSTSICTIVVECLAEDKDKGQLGERVRAALREALQVAPAIRFVEFGTLERTTFKAKRIEDKRKAN